ncbi:MAG: efflux RND transporter periplasmic adaptor subunit [Bacteroidota bacterium]|nr:efflux RND transporter periplasmic adaptor subunit [Bacteroidota bacterium]
MKKFGILLAISILAACGNIQNEENPNKKNVFNESLPSENRGIAVRLVTIIPQKFQHFIEINGSVRAEKDAIISPETSGQIKRIYVIEGQNVKKGKLIVSLNTSIIQSNINEVKTSLKLANLSYEKQAELWKENIGTEMQYLQAKNNKEALEGKLKTLQAQFEMANIKAPFDGVVDKIFAKEGELATPGVRIAHIINISQLKIYGSVSETFLPNIHKGASVFLSFPVYPGYTEKAEIYRKSEVINEKSRTFTIEIKLDNKESKLKPNMISKIKLNDFTTENAIVVPSQIIKQDYEGSFLYIVEKNGDRLVARKKYVKMGITYENNTMILEGLVENDKIIVVGYNMVSSGAHIYVAS